MDFLKNIIEFFKKIFFLAIYCFSFLTPRSKKTWIYGGYFRDNTKYFFLHNTTHFPGIKHIWISPVREQVEKLRAAGYKAYHKRSLQAIFYGLTAKVYIYDIVPKEVMNACFKGNAFLFNLWHGIPFKKIEYDITKGPSRVYFHPQTWLEKFKSFVEEPKVLRNSSAVLCTSKLLSDRFSSALHLPKEKVYVGPYPRNAVFTMQPAELEKHNKKFETATVLWLQEFSKYCGVIMYMPTFRDANPLFIQEAIPDFAQLNEACKKINYLFVIKAHISTKFNTDISAYSHIANLPSRIDIYPMLPYTDVLVSDYSSIFFDYSLTQKKIIFYPYDKDEYLRKSREAYTTYEEMFSEKYTSSFDELLNEICVLGKDGEAGKTFTYPQLARYFDKDTSLDGIVHFIQKQINYSS